MGVAGWLGAAGDLLLGGQCPGCDEPGWGLCPGCRRSAPTVGYLCCPEPCPVDFPLTATSAPYDGLMKRLISAHKERQALSLTPFLTQRLALAVGCLLGASDPAGPVVLVPVPSSPAAVRARGLDATWALARRLGRELSGTEPAGPDVSARRMLVLTRRVQDQAGLGAAARRDNLAGSMAVTGRGPGRRRVIIVDDVVTTGSSVAEAARALRNAGCFVLGAATVAATVRSRPGP